MPFSYFHNLFNTAFPQTRYTPERDIVLFKIMNAHTEPGRYYHNIRHLDYMGKIYDQSIGEAPPEIALAILYHDYVYNAGAKDNESRSAALCAMEAASIGGHSKAVVQRAVDMILTTRHSCGITSIVSDLDLHILAASRDVYIQYAKGIRMEWLSYSDADYSFGRQSFLEQMLSRGNALFGGHIESYSQYAGLTELDTEQALANMGAEFDFLSKGGSIICWQ